MLDLRILDIWARPNIGCDYIFNDFISHGFVSDKKQKKRLIKKG